MRGVCAALVVSAPLLLHCATAHVEAPKALPEPERFVDYSQQDIQSEILRLERLLADPNDEQWKDTTLELTRESVAEDLFLLHVHRLNPRPDYGKALGHARYLFEKVPDRRLYYSSWGQLLKRYLALSEKKDSLEAVIESTDDRSKDVQDLRYVVRRQAAQIDSLSAEIKSREETIKKLRQLEVQMERQRSRIQ